MAITDKEQGVWDLDEVYKKINQGGIWSYDGVKEVYAMGRNENGQLGQNNTTGYSSPTQIPGNWIGHFSKGSGMTNGCMLFVGKETAGTLWSWGQGWGGMLGQNGYLSISSPTQVGADSDWAHACAQGFSIGTRTDGTLWSWGYNNKGQLGQNQGPGNDQNARSSPIQIGTSTDWGTDDNKICCGDGVGLAIKADGTLWTWGRNDSGQLGVGDQGPGDSNSRSSPTQVGTDATWSKLANGGGPAHNAAIKTDGTLWTWGANGYGILGHNQSPGSPDQNYSSPNQVGTDTNWDSISMTGIARATKTDGTYWTWGRGMVGQLGLNNQTDYSSPVQLPGDWTANMSAGHPGSFNAVKTDGTLWSWGYNEYGVLGHNNRTEYSSPKQVGTGSDWTGTHGGSNVTFGTITK